MIGRISGQYTTEALNRKKSRHNVSYGSGYQQESDNADISSFGSLLSKVNAELKNIPEIREDKVAALKAQIDSGSYNPSLEKVANALYIAGILDAAEE